MKNQRMLKNQARFILAGALLVSLVAMAFIVSTAGAAPKVQATVTPAATAPEKACTDCHADKRDVWADSPHAHAADNPAFLAGWENMERSSECFLCHKATYDEATGKFVAEGVTCESCHEAVGADHPPAKVAERSDEEYCGTCHPSIQGEVQISGHTASNDVRCSTCHDPHSQKVMFKNPDDMCKDCHKEDMSAMDESIQKVHLQEDIACADCHMLDVPHTFLLNFKHEDTTPFLQGSDCTADVAHSVASRDGTSHEVPGSYAADTMNWPVVHRVSRVESIPECSDCHVMDEALRKDFIALGFSPEEVDQLSWERKDFPALTKSDLTKLVATPKRGWSWVFWMIGVAMVFGVFEFTVTRKLDGGPTSSEKTNLIAMLRSRFGKQGKQNKNARNDKE